MNKVSFISLCLLLFCCVLFVVATKQESKLDQIRDLLEARLANRLNKMKQNNKRKREINKVVKKREEKQVSNSIIKLLEQRLRAKLRAEKEKIQAKRRLSEEQNPHNSVIFNYPAQEEVNEKKARDLTPRNNITICPTSLSSYQSVFDCNTLQNIQNNLQGCYRLDLDLNCPSHTTITGDFKGTLAARGNTITGLTQPLFEKVGSGGCVLDLGIVSPQISSSADNDNLGALAKTLSGATITRVSVEGAGSIISTSGMDTYIGAIAGKTEDESTIFGCTISNDVTISASGSGSFAGGVTAQLSGNSIINITTTSADVSSTFAAGGLVAVMNSGTAQFCIVTGSVTVSPPVGRAKRIFGKRTISTGGSGFAHYVTNGSTVGSSLSNAMVTSQGSGSRFIANSSGSTGSDNFFNANSPFTLNGVAQAPSANGSFGSAIDPTNYSAADLIAAGIGPPIFNTPTGNGFPGFQPTAAGSVLNDPHFYPLWNHNPNRYRYTVFTKIKGAVFNIITHPMMQWNAMFDYYKNIPFNWKHPEYIVAAGFTFSHPNGMNDAHILVKPSTQASANYFDGNLLVGVNGKTLKKGQRYYFFGEQHQDYYVYKFANRGVIISTDYFYVKYKLQFITDNFIHNQRLLHKYLDGRPTARWPLLNSKVSIHENMESAHGILGQTARPESPYKVPTSNDCFECFVEGSVSDYRLKGDDLFGVSFKYNLFEKQK